MKNETAMAKDETLKMKLAKVEPRFVVFGLKGTTPFFFFREIAT